MIRLVGLIGSLRRGSYNRRLLAAAGRELPASARLDIFERLADIPPYSEDIPAPDVVRMLRVDIASADGLLIATPEYNASVPGHLKNALDWASRPYPDNSLRDKPAAVIGASTGLFGAVWAQAELRKILSTIGARMSDQELALGLAHEAFDDAGLLTRHTDRATLALVIEDLLRMVTNEAVKQPSCSL